ncbi:hypothetical protein [Nostoc sp. ChiQUE01b]|uniref:hypothetical protein n=1 Tax=Nostoc sp. ChiQUE01b TaxID=3075376 RepID=UPI002AD390B3|nr:hypothetical protein [Nostoc sp. ChiQUE01b]MDZ8260370.1 hypothetical protein [Nostoc sp. ChiQUE01b]
MFIVVCFFTSSLFIVLIKTYNATYKDLQQPIGMTKTWDFKDLSNQELLLRSLPTMLMCTAMLFK